MSQERLARYILLTAHTGKRPIGRPNPRWSDNISDLTWFHLGVEPADLSENAVTLMYVKSCWGCYTPATLPKGKTGRKVNE